MDPRVSDIVSATSGNLIVVAGAGTGKTYKLVQTCVQRIRDGAGIDEILIVTFTKAAAAELRSRIGAALQEAFAEEPESAHLQRQIAMLDRAQISTLHSFCLELVSRHFSDLGLSPRLGTLESARAAVLENEALDALFETYYEAKTPHAAAAKKLLLEWFKGDEADVRGILRKLHSFSRSLPDPTGWFSAQESIYAGSDPIHWREIHGQAVQSFLREWRPAVEAQADEKNPARAILLKLFAQGDVKAIAQLFDNDEAWPRGTKGRYRDPLKAMFSEAGQLGAWMKTGESDPLLEDWRLTRPAVLLLLEMARNFGAEFSRLKRERGAVDFSDLEQFSLGLLLDEARTAPTAIAERWRAKFKWIFVDEYQDINRAQDLILFALARPDENGNRFLVGDVKQSIYGFRQAEPKVFQKYQNDWAGGGAGRREFLTNNWRSHERILHFVNKLFTGIMSDARGGVVYDETAALRFGDDGKRTHLSAAADPLSKVEIHLIEKRGPEIDADETEEDSPGVLADFADAEAEAEVLARLFRQIAECGEAEYGDMVILMRSAASEVEAFAKVFSRHGIPFDARRSGFFSCIEALDLTSLLTILDNPLQDIPLLGVLRSPFGGFSLEDLAEVRLTLPRGAFWEALRKYVGDGKGEALEKASAFLERIRLWRELARHTSLSQRLEIILEESGYEDWVAAQDRGAQRRANVRHLIEIARQFDELHGEGLYPFLQHVEEQTNAIGDVASAATEAQGAVRLMTVHQSKGLQFPIVAVAGLHKRFNASDARGSFLVDEKFGLCLKARPPGSRRQYETLPFWAARRELEKRTLDEEMRILYVALTRAEKRLILSAAPDKKAREKWRTGEASQARSLLGWIGPWLAQDCPIFLEADDGQAGDWTWQWHRSFAPLGESSSSAVDFDFLEPESVVELKARLEWKYPFESATQQEAKSSATALRRAFADEPELARPLTRAPKSKLRANEIGQAAHRFLEHARLEALANEETLRTEIERLQQEAVLTPDEAASIDAPKILAFWNTPFGHELLEHAADLHRELIFTAKFTHADLQSAGAPINAPFAPDEFIVVQGAADLVAILPEEIWLVDFKTDRVPKKMLADRIEEYSLQLRIYARALARIYKRPVTRTCLHFLELARTEWIDQYQPGYLPLI